MTPILLAAAFWLVVTVHGEVVHQSGPMTGDACALQKAYRIIQIEQYAASGRPAPEQFVGADVKRGDVKVQCLRRPHD